MIHQIECSREECLRYILWKLGEEHARLVVKPQVSGHELRDLKSDEYKEYETNQAASSFVWQELLDIDIDPLSPPPTGTLIPGRRRKTHV